VNDYEPFLKLLIRFTLARTGFVTASVHVISHC